jgi:hypothetical protein
MDGYCVIPGVIPPGEVDAVRESMVNTLLSIDDKNATEESMDKGSILKYDQSIAPYLADRKIMDAAEAIFGPHVRADTGALVIRHPTPDREGRRAGLHVEYPYFPSIEAHVRTPLPDAVMGLQTIWFLTPFTSENGSTYVVPGSHRLNTNPQMNDMDVDWGEPYPTELQALGDAGSVLVWDVRLWHCTGYNFSDQDRVFFTTRYVPWWFNLDVDINASEGSLHIVSEEKRRQGLLPTEVYESLPEDVKPLLVHCIDQAAVVGSNQT